MACSLVKIIERKVCSTPFVGIPSFGSLHSVEPMSPGSSSYVSEPIDRKAGPFSGLVICVTGLSKEARKQVMFATERMGGQYSPDLHPCCTHLVVQIFGGRKFEHACMHGLENGLFIVTLGWFVDSVRRNIKLSESLYTVKNNGENGLQIGALHGLIEFSSPQDTCLPTIWNEHSKQCCKAQKLHPLASGKELKNGQDCFFSQCIYIDSNISSELQKKVIEAATREGSAFIDHWFIGCDATHVVCESPSILKYIGHANNLVTPMWILKAAKEKHLQRLVHLSTDLARQVGMMLEDAQIEVVEQNEHGQSCLHHASQLRESSPHRKAKQSLKKKHHIADLAKIGVRARRSCRMQPFQTTIRPITPSSLLDSICWSISEPTSTACIFTESSDMDGSNGIYATEFFDTQVDVRDSEATFNNFSRPLRESEKTEVIFKSRFLTILFPLDRFGELGPSSRTFFSDAGFTCIQLLDHIYSFYQENMSPGEIDLAIHTDSRHADRLRAVYASSKSAETGIVQFKRIDFVGSRRSFEMLKRMGCNDNSSVYELLIRA